MKKTTNQDIFIFNASFWYSILFFIGFFLSTIHPLFSQEKVTANFFYHQADSIASSLIKKPGIIQIKSDDVDTTGKANSWHYKFIDWDTSEFVDVDINSDSASYDTSYRSWCCFSSIDSSWIDSDSALAVAEANGGREFRKEYNDVQITAELFHSSGSPWTDWNVLYHSKKTDKLLLIQAANGVFWYTWGMAITTHASQSMHQSLQNYPNPFNASTSISFIVDNPGQVIIKILDITGREMDEIYHSFCAPGHYSVIWSPKELPSGIYYCEMRSDKTILSKKMMCLK